jgi:hypothetical protein
MIELTPFKLTPLGLFHTLLSLAGVGLALAALYRNRRVDAGTTIGRAYLASVLLTTVTGLPIFRHGAVTPPHILGVLTLLALAALAIARTTRWLGPASAYVETASGSATVLLMLIPTVTETLTRVPPSAPVAAGPDSPVVVGLSMLLIVVFLVAVSWQLRGLRVSRAPRAAVA